MTLIENGQKIAKWNDDLKRREYAHKCIQFYKFLHSDYVRDKIRELNPKTSLKVLPYLYTTNLTQRIIDYISILFNGGIKIKPLNINEESKIPSMLNSLLQQSKLNAVLDTVESYEKLLFKVLVHPRWSNGTVKLDILTPDMVFVEQDPENPTEAKSISYIIGELHNTNTSSDKKHIYLKWTKDTIEKIQIDSRDGSYMILEQSENPYGYIPITEFETEIQIDTYWPDRGQPVVEANELLDAHFSQFLFGLSYQEFSQAVLRGFVKDNDNLTTLTIGPSTPIMIPPNGMELGDFKYETPDADLQTLYNILAEQLPSQLAQSYGINPVIFKGNTNAFNSGYQLRLAKSDVINRSLKDREYYRPAIRNLIHQMIDCYNLNSTNTKFPENLDLLIDFIEPKNDVNPKETEELRKMKIENDSWNPIMSIMEDNPDLTRGEAERIYNENILINTKQTSEDLINGGNSESSS